MEKDLDNKIQFQLIIELLNRDYIFYKEAFKNEMGDNIFIGGEGILKNDEELTKEEISYKKKHELDLKKSKSNIFLFLEEGKCVIIGYKDYIRDFRDINLEARMIHNLSRDKFKINTFYRYLIGRKIDFEEIIDENPEFKVSINLDYIYRPYSQINGRFGRENGELYVEIMTYNGLIKRMEMRNEILEKVSRNRLRNKLEEN